jgi:hypothetical protein
LHRPVLPSPASGTRGTTRRRHGVARGTVRPATTASSRAVTSVSVTTPSCSRADRARPCLLSPAASDAKGGRSSRRPTGLPPPSDLGE